jgi:hypothetical protein
LHFNCIEKGKGKGKGRRKRRKKIIELSQRGNWKRTSKEKVQNRKENQKERKGFGFISKGRKVISLIKFPVKFEKGKCAVLCGRKSRKISKSLEIFTLYKVKKNAERKFSKCISLVRTSVHFQDDPLHSETMLTF